MFGEGAEAADQRAFAVGSDKRDIAVPTDLVRVSGELVEDEDEYVRLPVLWRPFGMDRAADGLPKQVIVAVGGLLGTDAFWRDGDEREARGMNLLREWTGSRASAGSSRTRVIQAVIGRR